MTRRVRLVLLIGACGLALLVWLARASVTEILRARVEHELSAALGVPAQLQTLHLSLVPLAVHAGGIVIGAAPVLARIEVLDARLWLLASLGEGRPVLTVQVATPDVDLRALPKSAPAAGAPAHAAPTLPPLHLREVTVRHGRLRFRMGDVPAQVTVGDIAGHLESAVLRRYVTIGADVRDVEMKRKTYHVKVGEIDADGGADGDGLFLRSGSLRGDGISVSAAATTVPHQCAVHARFAPSLLAVIVDELSFIGGTAQLDGTLRGNVANPILDAHLTVAGGAIANRPVGDLDAHVLRQGTLLRFGDLRISGPTGAAQGSADLRIEKTTPLDGRLVAQGIDLERLLALVGAPVPLRNRANATTTVHGTLDPLQLEIQGDGTLQAAAAGTSADLAGFALGGRIEAHAVDVHLAVNQPQRNAVTATLALARTSLRGAVRVQAEDLAALSAILPEPVRALGLAGGGDGDASLSGSIAHPVVGGSLALHGLQIAGVAVSRLTGDFRVAAQQLSTRSTRLETMDGSIEMLGTLALDPRAVNDWQLRFHALDTDLVLGTLRSVADLSAPLRAGRLEGTMTCRGTWGRAESAVTLAATGLQVAGEPLQRVDVQVQTTLPRWRVQLRATHVPGESLSIDGSGEGRGPVALRVDTTPWNLAIWRGAGRRGVGGSVTVHARVTGTLTRPDGDATVDGSGLTASGRHFGNVTVHAAGRGGSWTLQGSALGDRVSLTGTLRTAGDLPYTAGVRWQQADLSTLVAPAGDLHVVSSGTLQLAGVLRDVATPSGSLEMTDLQVTRDQGRVGTVRPIRVDLDHGRFRIRSLALAAQGSELSIAGSGGLDGALALDVQGNGDLVLLELIGRPFEATRGQFTVGASLRHAAAGGWEVRGAASVRDAAIDAGLPVAFTDTNGNITLHGSSVQIEHLSGRAGGGDYSLSGSVDLERGPDVSWSVHEVAFTMPQWLEERISGKGKVQGSWSVLTVSGDIEVLNALYDKNLELTDLVPWFREQVAPAPRVGPPVIEVRLDLHVHAPDGLFVDNNFAKVEMRADMHIGGSAQQLQIAGAVEILNGDVTFRNRVFRLTGGSIDFQSRFRINPALNLTAETQITTPEAEYTVTVMVSGTAEEPRVQFTADDPSLSQNDILSLVTFGHTTSEVQRQGGGIGTGDVLALLPSGYTGNVKGRLQSLFGVNRFEVEPTYLQDTGAIEPRVTIGKDLTDRLQALASSTFGVDTRRSMQLEYRVTQRVSLLGSWEGRTESEAGAFGGDIKFRYEFRRVPFSLFGSPFKSAPQTVHE